MFDTLREVSERSIQLFDDGFIPPTVFFSYKQKTKTNFVRILSTRLKLFRPTRNSKKKTNTPCSQSNQNELLTLARERIDFKRLDFWLFPIFVEIILKLAFI